MKKSNKTKMSYEPEADVLRIETDARPIDYASEVGNVVVHFSRSGKPVYFEILEAKKFLKSASSLLHSKISQLSNSKAKLPSRL